MWSLLPPISPVFATMGVRVLLRLRLLRADMILPVAQNAYGVKKFAMASPPDRVAKNLGRGTS